MRFTLRAQWFRCVVLASCCLAPLQLRAAALRCERPAHGRRRQAVARRQMVPPGVARGDVDRTRRWFGLAEDPGRTHAGGSETGAGGADGAAERSRLPHRRRDAGRPGRGRRRAAGARWLDGDIALLHLHGFQRDPGDLVLGAALRAMFARARRSRSTRAPAPYSAPPLDLNSVAARLIDKPLWLPAMRLRRHDGYTRKARPQRRPSLGLANAGDDPAGAVAREQGAADRLHRQ